MSNKTVYPASPYSFPNHWILKLFPCIQHKTRAYSANGFDPLASNIKIHLSASGWSNRLAFSSFKELEESYGYTK